MSANREPVSTVDDLETLDEDEVFEGYHDGREGFGCGDNRSRSYWHGWRNGRADAGLDEIDGAMTVLAHAYVRRRDRGETLH